VKALLSSENVVFNAQSSSLASLERRATLARPRRRQCNHFASNGAATQFSSEFH